MRSDTRSSISTHHVDPAGSTAVTRPCSRRKPLSPGARVAVARGAKAPLRHSPARAARALRSARRWLHRDADKVPAAAVPQLAEARATYPALDKMVTMREELRQLWLNTSHSREQLTADLQAWCRRAEESGIAALREFSLRLRSVQA